MNLTALSTTELTLIIALAVIVFAGIAAWQGKANTERLALGHDSLPHPV